jgi:L-rhamnose mutarotase
MRRYGMLIGIRPESIDEYRRLHTAVRPKAQALHRTNALIVACLRPWTLRVGRMR